MRRRKNIEKKDVKVAKDIMLQHNKEWKRDKVAEMHDDGNAKTCTKVTPNRSNAGQIYRYEDMQTDNQASGMMT